MIDSDTVASLISIPCLPKIHPHYEVEDQSTWFQDVFNHQLPRARVMRFHYDFAKLGGNAKYSAVVDWTNIIDGATDLLYSLTHRREEQDQFQRPIIFICHSFGGLILKMVQQLIENNWL